MERTYEELRDRACEESRAHHCYAAVADRCLSEESGTRMAVLSGTSPIVSWSRGPRFVRVICQFRNGLPYAPAGAPPGQCD